MTSKFTREELLNIIETDHVQCGEASALARMALAAMDSEPVAVVEPSDYVTAAQLVGEGPARKAVHELYEGALRIGEKLYRHAQQPVVPPMQHWEELCREHPDMSIGDAIIRAAWWNHCRTAMLQELQKSAGASNNCRSNEKVQVLHTIKAPPAMGSLSKTGEVLHTNSPVIPEGYVMVPKEPTEAMINAWLSEVANWRGHVAGYKAMLAAGPQEVK